MCVYACMHERLGLTTIEKARSTRRAEHRKPPVPKPFKFSTLNYSRVASL